MFKSYEDAVKFIETTHQKYKLRIKAPYRVEFSNRMRNCLGRCREQRLCGKPIQYIFTYNNKFIKANLNNDKIQDTVLHEIAHAIVGNNHGHDRVWKDCAQRIGCSGSRLATGIEQY